jgi:hypothetical protein
MDVFVTRYLFSIKTRPKIGKIIVILNVIVSIDGIINATDGVAHYIHLLGIGLRGWSKLNSKYLSILENKKTLC